MKKAASTQQNNERNQPPVYARKKEAAITRGGPLRFQAGLILALLAVYLAFEWGWPTRQEMPDIPELPEEPQVFYVMEAPPRPSVTPQAPEPPVKKAFKVTPVALPAPGPAPAPTPLVAPSVLVPSPSPNNAPPPGQPAAYSILAVQELPVFPGCEGEPPARQLACFQQGLAQHIRKNFRYPESARATGTSGRVLVEFVIDQRGEVGSMRLRGPAKILEEEAARILESLPRMLPGKVAGIPVPVRYTVPIHFLLD